MVVDPDRLSLRPGNAWPDRRAWGGGGTAIGAVPNTEGHPMTTRTHAFPGKARTRTKRATGVTPPGKRNADKVASTTRPADESHLPRKGTKARSCIDLLSRPAGAGIEELCEITGWQAHSVRGLMAGTIKKKLGLPLISEKPQDGRRRYRIVPAGS